MRKICIFAIVLIVALPLTWVSAVDRLPSKPEIDITYYNAGKTIETSTASALAIDEVTDRRVSRLNPASQARRDQNRRHFAIVCWTTVGLFLLLGFIWPPAGIAWQRFKKATLAFMVLTIILSLCGWRLQEHFASAGETATIVLGFSACASFGMPFTATLADKVLAAHKAPGSFAHAILSGIIGAGLGMILFTAGMYLVIFHTNAQYLSILGI